MPHLPTAARLQLGVTFASLAAALSVYAQDQLTHQPLHNSALTGPQFVQELLDNNNPQCMPDVLGVSKSMFQKLLAMLGTHSPMSDTRYLSMEEQLAIFLYFGHTNNTVCVTANRFQRSYDTIHK
jgi:hypothetical protein